MSKLKELIHTSKPELCHYHRVIILIIHSFPFMETQMDEVILQVCTVHYV